MIFSLNANLFGPDTQSHPGDILESALTVYRQSGRQSVVRVKEFGPTSVVNDSGQVFDKSILWQHRHIHFLFDSSREAARAVQINRLLADRILTPECVIVTDFFNGRDSSGTDVVTNFPVLWNDWQRSRVFSTQHLEMRQDVSQSGNYAACLGSEVYISASDVTFHSASEPLYQTGRLLWASTEPFGEWSEVDPGKELPTTVIEEPVLYLSHPFSGNFNIFFHETILAVMEFDKLPENTKVLVRGDEFRLDALRRLGVPSDRIIVAGNRPLLLRHVLIPIRRLNLKYVGARLNALYEWLADSLRAEIDVPSNEGKLIYLDRRRVPQNTGANRFIVNDEEVSSALHKRGAISLFLEDYDLVGKARVLSGADTIITTIGANLVNIGLSFNIKRVILISSPLWGHFVQYWISILRMRNPNVEIEIFQDCTVEDNGQSKDPFNKPYRVDVTSLVSIL